LGHWTCYELIQSSKTKTALEIKDPEYWDEEVRLEKYPGDSLSPIFRSSYLVILLSF